jgi:hypothetical protein
MLDGVLADMRRGNINHVLVKDRLGVSVWRKGRGGVSAEGEGPSPRPSPLGGEREDLLCGRAPRVARSSQPWAGMRNPAGVLGFGRRGPEITCSKR